MKKIKIMLTSIAVLAVVGGSLAFTAKNFGTSTFFHNSTVTGKCTVAEVLASTTIGATELFATYSTQSSSSVACTGINLISTGE